MKRRHPLPLPKLPNASSAPFATSSTSTPTSPLQVLSTLAESSQNVDLTLEQFITAIGGSKVSALSKLIDFGIARLESQMKSLDSLILYVGDHTKRMDESSMDSDDWKSLLDRLDRHPLLQTRKYSTLNRIRNSFESCSKSLGITGSWRLVPLGTHPPELTVGLGNGCMKLRKGLLKERGGDSLELGDWTLAMELMDKQHHPNLWTGADLEREADGIVKRVPLLRPLVSPSPTAAIPTPANLAQAHSHPPRPSSSRPTTRRSSTSENALSSTPSNGSTSSSTSSKSTTLSTNPRSQARKTTARSSSVSAAKPPAPKKSRIEPPFSEEETLAARRAKDSAARDLRDKERQAKKERLATEQAERVRISREKREKEEERRWKDLELEEGKRLEMVRLSELEAKRRAIEVEEERLAYKRAQQEEEKQRLEKERVEQGAEKIRLENETKRNAAERELERGRDSRNSR